MENDNRNVGSYAERALGTSFGSLSKFTIRDESEMPVQIDSSSWSRYENPERLYRIFKFDSFKSMLYFINESLKEQERINHHSKMTIDHLDVSVEIYTKDVNAITESDLILSKFFNEIYEDVVFMQLARRRAYEREVNSLS